MQKNWTNFYKKLPKQVKLFLTERVGDAQDFEFRKEMCGLDTYCFFSPSTKIEISIWGDMFGVLFAVWFPEAEKNNDEGDPTVTDHELTINFPLMSYLYENFDVA